MYIVSDQIDFYDFVINLKIKIDLNLVLNNINRITL